MTQARCDGTSGVGFKVGRWVDKHLFLNLNPDLTWYGQYILFTALRATSKSHELPLMETLKMTHINLVELLSGKYP